MKTYGVVAGIREGVKLGWLYLTDIACLALVIGPSIFLDQLFPADQGVESAIFLALSVILAFYLDLHPRTNPGKRNFEVIWMLITHRQSKLFKSYGYYEFKPFSEIRKERQNNGN